MRKKISKPTLLLFYGIVLFSIFYASVNYLPVVLNAKTTSTSKIWITKQKHESYMLKHSYNSTCSHSSDSRGPHQRVIAYSLYGNVSIANVSNRYLEPLKHTISMIPRIYPGWIVRIYHNFTSDVYLSPLVHSHVDLCNATEIIEEKKIGNIFAMTWRWLPLLDDMVDILMSRDSDSPIVTREEDAVHEWFTSDRTFHIMRDHPAHCIFGFIMGCCWGVKVNQSRPKIVHAAEEMFKTNHLHEYDYDQILLDRFIWPVARNDVIAHDSYCCEGFRPTQPFPKQRTGRIFVGARSTGLPFITESLSDIDKCPVQCRPTMYASTNWEYC